MGAGAQDSEDDGGEGQQKETADLAAALAVKLRLILP